MRVTLAPPCSCGANLHLVGYPHSHPVWGRVARRRLAGCHEHHRGPWRAASWESGARWPFRWPWGRP